ncbi:MAG: tetratricopeptide repeat protein [Acidobacteria bacterium]|nr:MAG: tetratricopeptide repeat protein [Acidobacteriota bacterium]
MIGTDVGPYRVIERLGAGGMGEVFLAEDTRLRRKVALKRLMPHAVRDGEARARALHEARTVARLHHPGIATVFDVLEGDDTLIIVMEYVEGETLGSRIARGALPAGEAVDLGIQLADALADAHSHGVLHCDLKPANVHLTRGGRAKILDFGLAQLSAKTRASEDTRIASTVHGLSNSSISGSPGYMAPERLSDGPLDERVDIYSLGVVLFEMLTGRRPFDGSNLVSAAVQALTVDPPAPMSIVPSVPAAINDVVLKSIARVPAARYQTAQELANALRAAAGGSVAAAAPPPTRSSRSRGRVALAAALLVVAGTASIWLSGWRPWRSPTRGGAVPTVVVKPFANLAGDATNEPLGVGIADDLTAKLAALPNLAVVSRDVTAAYLVKSPASATIARDLGATYVVDGGFERAGDNLKVTLQLRAADGQVVWKKDFQRPLPQLFALQRDLAEGLADGLDLTLTRKERGLLASESTRDVDALADYSQGRLFLDRRDQKGNVDHAIEAFTRAIGRDASFALAHAGLGAAYWEKYVDTKDAAWTARAIGSSLTALRLDPNNAEVHVSLGTVYSGLGQFTTAKDELQQALVLRPTSDDAHRVLGDVLAKEGKTDDAVREYERAIAIRPNYWQNHNRLAATLMKVGRYHDAETAYRRITELQPDSSVGFNNLGVVLMMQDNLPQGLESLTRAADITPKPGTFSNIGTIHFWNGRFDEARKAYLKAIALSPADASLARNLGDALGGLGDTAGAAEAYRHALDLAMNQWRVNPNDAAVLGLVGVLEAKLGRKAEARTHIDQALALAPNDSEVYYRSAVIAALAREADRAVADLRKAIAAGYSVKLVKRDLDLRGLHDRPDYLAVVNAQRPT